MIKMKKISNRLIFNLKWFKIHNKRFKKNKVIKVLKNKKMILMKVLKICIKIQVQYNNLHNYKRNKIKMIYLQIVILMKYIIKYSDLKFARENQQMIII